MSEQLKINNENQNRYFFKFRIPLERERNHEGPIPLNVLLALNGLEVQISSSYSDHLGYTHLFGFKLEDLENSLRDSGNEIDAIWISDFAKDRKNGIYGYMPENEAERTFFPVNVGELKSSIDDIE
jgi:hypothetical protein